MSTVETLDNVLKPLQEEIVYLTYELNYIGNTLKDLDLEFENTQSDESRTFLMESIELYKTKSEKLRILLEAYFFEETKLGFPADILMRRLYKRLTG